MTPPVFKKAERKQAKLRLGISGPAGSGKTYSALQIAFGLGGRIAVVDTEHSSAELYAHLGDYDVAVLEPPFTVQKYLDAIKGAEAAGYTTIIIDSLSHAWAGEGGLLDQQGALAKRGVNSYTAWRDITPMHTQLVEAMLQSPCHIIATMRSKTDYVLQENGKGKMAPIKVGMAPVQRDGMDYEFTVVFDMGLDHTASVSKDRTSMFTGQYFTPSIETGQTLLSWLTTGAAAPAPVCVPPAPVRQTSTIAEPTKVMTPVMPTSTEPAVPIETCDVCGRDTGTYPALRVRNRDGRNICDSCHRKAEKAESIARPSPAEPAPVAEIGGEYVCTECGRQVTGSERKTSLLFVQRVLCGKCIQALDSVEPAEARA